jgi:hypothetical protein
MARDTQERLCRYTAGGGCLVLFPRIPMLDAEMRACTTLADLIGCVPLKGDRALRTSSHPVFRSINFGPRKGVLLLDEVDCFDMPLDCQAIATESRSGKVCAFRRPVGRGQAVMLGFKPTYVWDAHLDHKALIHTILDAGGVRRCAYTETGELIVKERVAGRRGFLSVINPVNIANTSRIIYADPETRRPLSLPHLREGLVYTRQGGTIMCLDVDLPALQARIAYCTAELISLAESGTSVEIVIREDKSAYAEIAVEADGQMVAYVDDRLIEVSRDEAARMTYVPVPLGHATPRIRLERHSV